jgi:hypothetical protein
MEWRRRTNTTTSQVPGRAGEQWRCHVRRATYARGDKAKRLIAEPVWSGLSWFEVMREDVGNDRSLFVLLFAEHRPDQA